MSVLIHHGEAPNKSSKSLNMSWENSHLKLVHQEEKSITSYNKFVPWFGWISMGRWHSSDCSEKLLLPHCHRLLLYVFENRFGHVSFCCNLIQSHFRCHFGIEPSIRSFVLPFLSYWNYKSPVRRWCSCVDSLYYCRDTHLFFTKVWYYNTYWRRLADSESDRKRFCVVKRQTRTPNAV